MQLADGRLRILRRQCGETLEPIRVRGHRSRDRVVDLPCYPWSVCRSEVLDSWGRHRQNLDVDAGSIHVLQSLLTHIGQLSTEQTVVYAIDTVLLRRR